MSATLGAAAPAPRKRGGPRRHPAVRTQSEAWQLVMENRGLAFTYAFRLEAARPDLVAALGGRDDVVQLGLLGMFRAAEIWQPERGAAFSTFAWFHLKCVVGRAYEQTGSTIRVPSHPVGGTRAENLARVQAFPFAEDADGRVVEPAAPADDADDLRPDLEDLAAVRAAVEQLPPVEREVIEAYYFTPGGGGAGGESLAVIGRRRGLSRERIRQIRDAALDMLRETLPARLVPGAEAAAAG
jgi:RNA polymerase sigma factor (sigma-70 family)